MTHMKPVMIISTYPSKRSVTAIAKRLLADRVIACVNISKISSLYTWDGKMENATEYIAIFKTVPKNKTLLKDKIRETHPYDTPEIAELSVTDINKPYLDWLLSSTS